MLTVSLIGFNWSLLTFSKVLIINPLSIKQKSYVQSSGSGRLQNRSGRLSGSTNVIFYTITFFTQRPFILPDHVGRPFFNARFGVPISFFSRFFSTFHTFLLCWLLKPISYLFLPAFIERPIESDSILVLVFAQDKY